MACNIYQIYLPAGLLIYVARYAVLKVKHLDLAVAETSRFAAYWSRASRTSYCAGFSVEPSLQTLSREMPARHAGPQTRV